MLTRCPQCETIFRVSKKHISAAKGLVRCGSCKDIFNAKEHVIKSKKDLKKPTTTTTTKPESQVTAKATENNLVDKKSIHHEEIRKKQTVKSEPDSFDFINDGFTSTGDFNKFNSTSPSIKPSQKKKPASKAEALERGKSSNSNFDFVFEDEAPNISTKDNFNIKKPTTPESKVPSATFETKTLQTHKATVVQATPQSKLNKTGNFISQNVIDIKNAFTSISKKLSSKVTNKIQHAKQPDKVVKKALENKLNNSNLANNIKLSITETTVSTTASTTSTATRTPQKKPAVMSIDSETNIFSSSKNSTEKSDSKHSVSNKANDSFTSGSDKKPALKVKTTQKLKEDAALKLAIQLKKAAQDKHQSTINKKINNDIAQKVENKPTPKPEIKKFKPDLNIVNSSLTNKIATAKTENKKVQNQQLETKLQLVDSDKQVQKAKRTKVKEKLDGKNKKLESKDSKLIPKEDTSTDKEPAEVLDNDRVHIHMQTMDIPMVLRESLEELDLPARSAEMTIFMILSLIILCAGLLLQFVVFRSIEVQQSYPTLTPLITKVCKTFTCDYSGPRDISKIQLISRDIRVHPTTKGALLISATIINNANYQQPYPNFTVKLSNLSGKTTAQRFFAPQDYLGKLSNKLLLMPPKQPIRIALEVVDPGKEAINFEFKFLAGN